MFEYHQWFLLNLDDSVENDEAEELDDDDDDVHFDDSEADDDNDSDNEYETI